MNAATSTATAAPAERAQDELREQTAQFGMWIFIATEILFFGGLLFAYLILRIAWPQAFASAARHTDVVLGTLNTAVLLTSSFTMALAVTAAEVGAWARVAPLLRATVALGLVFLAIKGFEYHQDWQEGLVPGAGFRLGRDAQGPPPMGAELFFVLYWVLTVLHSVHLCIGMGIAGVFSHGSARRRPWVRVSRLQVAGLYWHFVDIVWILLYPLLYLVLRHP